MRHFSKRWLTLLVLTIGVLASVQVSQAAGKEPGKVKKLKITQVTDTTAKLTWSEAENAATYRVYKINTETGKRKQLGETKERTYTVKKLKAKETYSFQVFACSKSDKMAEEGSPVVSLTADIVAPAEVKNFKIASSGDRSFFLTWSKADNADRYIIYQYDDNKGKYVKLASTAKTEYQVKGLTDGKKYAFRIQSWHKASGIEKVSELSAKITGTAKKLSLSAVHGRYWNATTTKAVTATDKNTGKKVSLKAGTKLITVYAIKKNVTAYVGKTSGQKITVNGANLKYGNLYTEPKYYSDELAEAWVNKKGYTSPTKRLIWVSQFTLSVYVFEGSAGKWNLVRKMPCIVGAYGKTTPGTYHLDPRSREIKNGRPQIYFSWNPAKWWGNSFHCRIDGNTRAAVSSGCVRLGDSDLQFIATCPSGTTVISY